MDDGERASTDDTANYNGRPREEKITTGRKGEREA